MSKAMKLKLIWKLKVAKLAILSVSRAMSTGEEWARGHGTLLGILAPPSSSFHSINTSLKRLISYRYSCRDKTITQTKDDKVDFIFHTMDYEVHKQYCCFHLNLSYYNFGLSLFGSNRMSFIHDTASKNCWITFSLTKVRNLRNLEPLAPSEPLGEGKSP